MPRLWRVSTSSISFLACTLSLALQHFQAKKIPSRVKQNQTGGKMKSLWQGHAMLKLTYIDCNPVQESGLNQSMAKFGAPNCSTRQPDSKRRKDIKLTCTENAEMLSSNKKACFCPCWLLPATGCSHGGERKLRRWLAKCISRALELGRKVRWIAKVVPVLTLLIKCQLAAGLYVSFTVNSTRRQHHAHASPWGEEYGNMFTSWKNIIPCVWGASWALQTLPRKRSMAWTSLKNHRGSMSAGNAV